MKTIRFDKPQGFALRAASDSYAGFVPGSLLASRRAVRLVLLAEAEAELDETATWYDERRDGLGDELLIAVHSGFIVISEAPESWPRWPDTPQDLLLRRQALC